MAKSEAAKPLRWGILGAARIAQKSLIPAIRAAGGEVVAIGASTRARAETFAKENGIARAYEGYQRVLEDDEVDAVYLPLANGLHLEWGVKTAQALKPCLLEKPMTLNAADARELRAEFSRAGVRLQEAFMWRHHAQIEWARKQVESGAIGKLQRIHTSFSFTLDRPADYRWKPEQGGGALWDIGCYCVNASRYFFGREPEAASVAALIHEKNRVDESAVGWLDFGNGNHAAFTCSFNAMFHQSIDLIGTEARIWIAKPWLQVGQETKVMIERDGEKTIQQFEPMNAYAAMIANFTRAVRDDGAALAPGEDGQDQAIAMEGVLQSAMNGGEVWRRAD